MPIKKEKIGNITWNILHTITYQTENVNSLKAIWNAIIILYPCKECRGHIQKLMSQGFSTQLQSVQTPHEFAMFLYKIHNSVNQRLRKKFSITMTEQDKQIFANQRIFVNSEEEKLTLYQTTFETLMKQKLTNSKITNAYLGHLIWILLHTLVVNSSVANLHQFVILWKEIINSYSISNPEIQQYLDLQTSRLEELVYQQKGVNAVSLWLSTVHNKVSEILSKKKYILERTISNRKFYQQVIKEETKKISISKNRSFQTQTQRDIEQETLQSTAQEKTMMFQLRGCYGFQSDSGCGCNKTFKFS